MATESEKSVSELAAEAYLQFMNSEGPDDPAYNSTYERLEKFLSPLAKGYTWKVLGGKGNEHRQQLVDAVAQNILLKIIRQQRGDISPRTGRPLGGIWSPKVNENGTITKFTTWFYRVVGNAVRSELRQRDNATPLESVIGKGSDQGETGDFFNNMADKASEISLNPERDTWGVVVNNAIAAEEAESLKDCVDKLDEVSKRVIHLRYYEGQNLREIAEHFGWFNEWTGNPQTAIVYNLLENAQPQLAECMGSKGH